MTEDVLLDARARRVPRRVLAGIAAGLLAIASLGGIAVAVHDEAFELEGNTTANDAPSGVGHPDADWQSFFTNTGGTKANIPGDFSAPTFRADHAGADTTAYATGSKDNLPITTGWQCKSSNNIGPKFNILNAYAVAYTDPDDGDTILYTGVERESNNGTSNVGVWYLQNEVGCTAGKGGGSDFSGAHADGDVFVVSEFSSGGTVSDVKAYVWKGDDATGFLDPSPILTGADCKETASVPDSEENDENHPNFGKDRICATVNTAPITTGWPSPDADNGPLNERQFFEVGINISRALPNLDNPCFASFLANTRSSDTLGSTIHDFAIDSFQVCKPSTKLTKTVESVTYKYIQENDGSGGVALKPPADDEWVVDDKCSPVTPVYKPNTTVNAGDTDNDGLLQEGEQWQFTCTKAVDGADVTATDGTNTARGRAVFDPGAATDDEELFTGCPTGTAPETPADAGGGVDEVTCDADAWDKATITVTHGAPPPPTP